MSATNEAKPLATLRVRVAAILLGVPCTLATVLSACARASRGHCTDIRHPPCEPTPRRLVLAMVASQRYVEGAGTDTRTACEMYPLNDLLKG